MLRWVVKFFRTFHASAWVLGFVLVLFLPANFLMAAPASQGNLKSSNSKLTVLETATPAAAKTAAPVKAAPAKVIPATAPVKIVPDKFQNNAGQLLASFAGQTIWHAPVYTSAASKNSQPILVDHNLVYSSEGNTVAMREVSTGKVLRRWFFSGLVTSLESQIGGLRVVCTLQDSLTENFSLSQDMVLERVVFEPSPLLIGTLEDVARKSFDDFNQEKSDPLFPKDPTLAMKHWQNLSNMDPTNPFYAFFLAVAAEHANKMDAANTHYKQVADVEQPFYLNLRLAALLEEVHQTDTAQLLLDQAGESYANYGYDPGHRVGRAALVQYGDPLATLTKLFKSGQVLRGAAWLGFMRSTMPKFEGSQMMFGEYATWLEKQGEVGVADQWHGFVKQLADDSPLKLGERGLPILSAFGLLLGVAALLSHFLARLVLTLRYATVRGPQMIRMGGAVASWWRAPLSRFRFGTLAYARPSERINVLILLLLALLGLLTWSWAHRAGAVLRAGQADAMASNSSLSGVAGIGTLGGAHFWSREAENLFGPGGALLRGLAAQQDHNLERASAEYKLAEKSAAALNNLGVLEEQRGNVAAAGSDYRAALARNRNLIAACHNLARSQSVGGTTNACPLDASASFQITHLPEQAMLALPNSQELLEARRSTPTDELIRLFNNPTAWLQDLPVTWPLWLRSVALVFLGILLFSVVLWLLMPRPAVANKAPRHWLHQGVALLLPGVGFLSEAWGLLLFFPFVFSLLLLVLRFKPGVPLGIFVSSNQLGLADIPSVIDPQQLLGFALVVLAVLYAVNLLLWLLELWQAPKSTTELNAPIAKK